MTEKGLLGTGIAGIVALAVCCLGPSLVVLLGAAGLWAWLGYTGGTLLVAMVVIVLAAGYAVWRRRTAPHGRTSTALDGGAPLRRGQ